MKARKPTVNEYLAKVPPAQRAALQRLRKTIKAAAPNAEECISYGIPAYSMNGFLVGFGASKAHCSFYPGATISQFKDLLKGYSTSKGTIRFQPEKPIPAALVKKIMKRRIAERMSQAQR